MTRRFALDLEYGRAVAVAIDDRLDDDPAVGHAPPGLGPIRRRQWLAGRTALGAALEDIGLVCDLPITSDDRGAPRLPPAMVGSISHKRDVAIGLAAPARGWTVGIDLEIAAPRRLDLSARVLTADELADLAGLDEPARALAVIQVFAIKEAIYKAIDPFMRRYVGFREVSARPRHDGTVAVVVPASWKLEVEARWRTHDEFWIATARARPGTSAA